MLNDRQGHSEPLNLLNLTADRTPRTPQKCDNLKQKNGQKDTHTLNRDYIEKCGY